MKKGIVTMFAVVLLSVAPCLAAELEFPQVDELWGASRDEAWKTAEAARIRAERDAAG